MHIRHIRQEYHQHMNNFGYDSRREAVVPFRLLVVKHIFAQHSRENTGKNCGNTAGKASIFAGTPENGKPTLDAADYACYDSCGSTEEKPCADRRGIAGIYDCAVDFYAEFGAHDCQCPEHDSYQYLPCNIRYFTRGVCPLCQIDECRQYHRAKRYEKKQKVSFHISPLILL